MGEVQEDDEDFVVVGTGRGGGAHDKEEAQSTEVAGPTAGGGVVVEGAESAMEAGTGIGRDTRGQAEGRAVDGRDPPRTEEEAAEDACIGEAVDTPSCPISGAIRLGIEVRNCRREGKKKWKNEWNVSIRWNFEGEILNSW